MDKNFTRQRLDDWLCWIGEPMMYDYGFYVNRTPEEHKMSDMLYDKRKQ